MTRCDFHAATLLSLLKVSAESVTAGCAQNPRDRAHRKNDVGHTRVTRADVANLERYRTNTGGTVDRFSRQSSRQSSQQNRPFDDRQDAGRQLGELLRERLDDDTLTDAVVLGLARGGIPVAYEVAKCLERPLDVFVVRKLGAPGHGELAIGAIASGGVRVMNDDVVRQMGVSDDATEEIAEKEHQELQRREQRYRGAREAVPLEGRPVILVDDGLATGASMRAAVSGLEQRNPSKIVVAVPTGAPDTCAMFEDRVDTVVCVQTPQPFGGVGRWYTSFPQTRDDEVTDLLEKSVS